MKWFNSFQAVTLFAAWPFLIGWLIANPFAYSTALMWAGIVAYVVGFFVMVACVRVAMDSEK